MAFFLKAADNRVRPANGFSHPTKVVPHQQVFQELDGDIALYIRPGAIETGQLRQPAVRGKSFDDSVGIGPQALVHQVQEAGRTGLRQGLAHQGCQYRITNTGAFMSPALDLHQVFFNLFQQHRRKVHHGPGIRVGFQVGGHVGVVFDAVQVHPGEQEFAGTLVLIVRLMHVPAKHDRCAVVRGHGGSPAPASPGLPAQCLWVIRRSVWHPVLRHSRYGSLPESGSPGR